MELATAVFASGATRALIGTRAMLGEGWDAPCVNCLVDLSSATTATSVQQSRGRALRLDPADPAKIASNWDIICVAPELARGTGDYQRFVRKHLHVFAPSEDGAIEAGPSHVHPSLGPVRPAAGRRVRADQPVDGGPYRGARGRLGALADRRALHRIKPAHAGDQDQAAARGPGEASHRA